MYHAAATPMIWVYHLPCQDGAVQDSTLLSQTSLRWRRALSPRKSSLQEDWVLRGLTLHQLKDIITDIYASKAKADSRQAQPFHFGSCLLCLPHMQCADVTDVVSPAHDLS